MGLDKGRSQLGNPLRCPRNSPTLRSASGAVTVLSKTKRDLGAKAFVGFWLSLNSWEGAMLGSLRAVLCVPMDTAVPAVLRQKGFMTQPACSGCLRRQCVDLNMFSLDVAWFRVPAMV